MGSNRLYFNPLGRDTHRDRIRLYISRRYSHGTEQPMLVHTHTAHDGRMIGYARFRPNLSPRITDNHAVADVVLMRVHVGIVRYLAALADDNLTAVVQQHILVDYTVILD